MPIFKQELAGFYGKGYFWILRTACKRETGNGVNPQIHMLKGKSSTFKMFLFDDGALYLYFWIFLKTKYK